MVRNSERAKSETLWLMHIAAQADTKFVTSYWRERFGTVLRLEMPNDQNKFMRDFGLTKPKVGEKAKVGRKRRKPDV